MKKAIVFGMITLLLTVYQSAFAHDEICGKITAMDTKNGEVEVWGVVINAEGAEIEDAQSLTDLKVGDFIEAEGMFTGPARMMASEIERKTSAKNGIKGEIDAVNPEANTLMVNGIKVKLLKSTRIKGLCCSKATGISGASVGDKAECEGAWTGNKELTATKVEIDSENRKGGMMMQKKGGMMMEKKGGMMGHSQGSP